MPERYTVRVTKDYLVFCSGPLHHLRRRPVRAAARPQLPRRRRGRGALDAEPLRLRLHRPEATSRAITDELDHQMLLPTRSNADRRRGRAGAASASGTATGSGSSRADDCVLLPIENTTAELLARYIAGRLPRGAAGQARVRARGAPGRGRGELRPVGTVRVAVVGQASRLLRRRGKRVACPTGLQPARRRRAGPTRPARPPRRTLQPADVLPARHAAAGNQVDVRIGGREFPAQVLGPGSRPAADAGQVEDDQAGDAARRRPSGTGSGQSRSGTPSRRSSEKTTRSAPTAATISPNAVRPRHRFQPGDHVAPGGRNRSGPAAVADPGVHPQADAQVADRPIQRDRRRGPADGVQVGQIQLGRVKCVDQGAGDFNGIG